MLVSNIFQAVQSFLSTLLPT